MTNTNISQLALKAWFSLCLAGLLSLGSGLSLAQAPSADEMVDRARAEGLLAKVLYVVFTQGIPGAALPEGISQSEIMTQHMDYQKKLEKEGVMFGAGPFSAEGMSAQGMIVIRANSEQEARSIADADPMHKYGQRQYSLGRWQINEGTVTIRVNFSDGSYEFD